MSLRHIMFLKHKLNPANSREVIHYNCSSSKLQDRSTSGTEAVHCRHRLSSLFKFPQNFSQQGCIFPHSDRRWPVICWQESSCFAKCLMHIPTWTKKSATLIEMSWEWKNWLRLRHTHYDQQVERREYYLTLCALHDHWNRYFHDHHH
jgi:hypothetical protein